MSLGTRTGNEEKPGIQYAQDIRAEVVMESFNFGAPFGSRAAALATKIGLAAPVPIIAKGELVAEA